MLRLPSILALAALATACDLPSAPSTEQPLPAADPGRLLPVEAGGSDPDFPTVGWDFERNALILVEQPHWTPSRILRIDPDQLTTTVLKPAPAGVQQLRVGAGTILYSNSNLNDGTTAALRSVTSGLLADITRVQFMLSDNGRWLVYHADGWRLRNLEDGTEVSLPASNDPPIAVANGGDRIAFGRFDDFYSSPIRILTVSTGAVASMPRTGTLFDVAFSQSELHMLTASAEEIEKAVRMYQFFDRSESGQVTALGEWKVPTPNGFAAQICGAWSRGAEPRTAVVGVQMTYEYSDADRRIHFVRLGDTVQVVATVDAWAVTDCSVSPDGRWFVYGTNRGYTYTNRLFVKGIK